MCSVELFIDSIKGASFVTRTALFCNFTIWDTGALFAQKKA